MNSSTGYDVRLNVFKYCKSMLKDSQLCPTKIITLGASMTSKAQTLQDPFLNALRKERIQVSIYLVNGIKLQGYVESFDQYVILLRNTVTQMVYKHAVSTIVPAKSVNMADSEK